MKKIIELIVSKIYNFHALCFGRPFFSGLNGFLMNLGMRGLGIMNYSSDRLTGEKYLLHHFLPHFLKGVNKPIIFDVGANVGLYTKQLRTMFPEASIHAFEPQPNNFRLLELNVQDKNISLYNIGLGEKKDVLPLYDYDDQEVSEHASFSKGVIEGFYKRKGKKIDVPVDTLDSICMEAKIDHIDFLKVDTEGFELFVVKGAKNILKNTKILQLEFTQLNAYNGILLKDIIDLFPGFAIFRLLPTGLLPLGNYDPLTWEIFGFQNIVLINKSFS